MLINIIGAGHVGKTIGYLMVKFQAAIIGSVCNQSESSSQEAIDFIGQGQYCQDIQQLPPADLTLITTPDDCIASTAELLSQNKQLQPGQLVMHCSGSLTSDVLEAVKKKGCFVASVHPMRSFAEPALSAEHYGGTYCAVEGDSEALDQIRFLFEAFGSITYTIDKNHKALYHVAGVFASNYLVTLADQARSCMQKAGVEGQMAMRVITNIMHGTITNLETTLSPTRSLTGPIRRGDLSTLKKHLNALEPLPKLLYSVLGQATLNLTFHDEEVLEDLRTLFR